ncbi:hypothetical protein ARMGADRAFT_336020 [Armillaria gallica]|uniref:Uncharacterized protein n=1 Tax=Armillaria gallica TaxID=47427 RepID=A0A2H3DP73_ARMGA|nr:hypothetical protein ARMGADRAFT_336020 [Armillaria gallica]
MWMFRDGRLFSKLTDVIQGATFTNWLDDCLSASAIADSAPINVEDYLSGGEEQDESENGDEEEEDTTESEHVEGAQASPEEQLEVEGEDPQPPSEGPPVEEEALVAEGASDQDTADAGDEEAEDAGGEEADDVGDEKQEDEQEPEEESICTHLATIRNADVRNCHSKSHHSRSSMLRYRRTPSRSVSSTTVMTTTPKL